MLTDVRISCVRFIQGLECCNHLLICVFDLLCVNTFYIWVGGSLLSEQSTNFMFSQCTVYSWVLFPWKLWSMQTTRLYKVCHYHRKCLPVLVTLLLLLLLLLLLHHCSHINSTLVLRTVYSASKEDSKLPADTVDVALMSYLSLLNTALDKQKFILRIWKRVGSVIHSQSSVRTIVGLAAHW